MRPLSVLVLLVASQVAEASTIYDENAVVADNKVIRRTQRSEELVKLVDQQKDRITELGGQLQTCDKERARLNGDAKACADQVVTFNLNFKSLQSKYDGVVISLNDGQKQLDKCNEEFKGLRGECNQQGRKFNDQIAELTRQNEELARRAKKAEDLVAEWEAKYRGLQDQANGQKRDCDAVGANLETARKRVAKLEGDVADQSGRAQQCRDEFAQFRDKAAGRDTEFQGVREQLKKLAADFDIARAAAIKSAADFDVLRQTADKCRRDFDGQTVSFTDLQGRFSNLDQRFGGLTLEYNNFKVDNQKLVDRFAAVQKAADTLLAERDACRKTGDGSKQQIDQLNLTINEINIRLGDFRQRAEKAEAQIAVVVAQCKKDRQDADKAIADLNVAINDWQGRFKARDGDFAGLQDKCGKQLADAENRFAQLRDDRDAVKKGFEDLRITFKQVQDVAGQCDRDFKLAREKNDKIVVDFNNLRGVFDKLQSDNNGLVGRFKKISDDFGLTQEQFKRCDGELGNARDRANKAEATLVQTAGQLKDAANERDQLRKAGDDFRKQLKQGQDKLDKLQKQLDKTLALCDLEVGDALVGSAF